MSLIRRVSDATQTSPNVAEAVHATLSVGATEVVVVAQPGRVRSSVSSGPAYIARLADEIEGMGGGLREGFGPAGALRLPFTRHFEHGENDLRQGL